MSKKNKFKPTATPVVPVSSLKSQVITGLSLFGIIWAIATFKAFVDGSPGFSFLYILNEILPDGGFFPHLAALLDYAKGFFWGALLLMSGFAAGQVISRFKSGSALCDLVLQTAIGFGILAYVTLVLGCAGFLYRTVFVILVAALAGVALLLLARGGDTSTARQAVRELRDVLWSDSRNGFLSALLLFVLVTAFVMVFVPELFYDALVYHLGVPDFYLSEHRIVPIDLLTSKFPFTVQMLHVIGLALKDEMVTKFTQFSALTLIVLGLCGLGKKMDRSLWGLLTALLFVSIPTVQMNAWTSGVDVVVSLFGFAAFTSLLRALEADEIDFKWTTLSGVFAGLAVASKYTAAIVPTAIFLTVLIVAIKRRRPVVEIFARLSVFSVVVALVMLPWLVKNFHETGNPLYPFATKIFGGVSLEPWRYATLKGENNGLSIKGIGNFLASPWKLSIQEKSSLSFQGPLFLALIPLVIAAFLGERPKWMKQISVYAALYLVMAFFMTRLSRYWMPGMMAVSAVVAFAVERGLKEGAAWKKMYVWAALLVGYLTQLTWCYVIIGTSYQPHDVLIGTESREHFVNHYHNGMNPNPSNQMYRYLDANPVPGMNVLIVGDEKGYPFATRHFYSGVYDNGPLVRLANDAPNAEALAKALRAAGFTHLLVNIYEAERLSGYGILGWTPKGFGVFASFWEKYVRLDHIERAPLAPNVDNPLLLLAILDRERLPAEQGVQNVLAPIYERGQLPRLGIETDRQKIEFYLSRLQEQPKVEFFQERIAQLSQNH